MSATIIEGENDADWWIMNYKTLPLYYITAEELIRLGWRDGNKPSRYAPGKMFTGGIYYNSNSKLPSSPGRIWYEADLNYYGGRRNSHRIVWSDNGLIFVTFDHYLTFIEIK